MICLNCGIDCNRKFCSVECYNDYRKNNITKRKNKFYECYTRCENCDEWFKNRVSDKNVITKRHCSRSCAISTRNRKVSKRPILEKKCENCGKTFFVKDNYGKGIYCSKSCTVSASNRNNWKKKEYREKITDVLKKNTINNAKIFSPSSQEKRFKNALIENKIRFKHQFYIKEAKHHYDFLLYPDTIVEIDGDYWHNPIIFKERAVNDKRCEKIAFSHNYDMIRYSESNINENLEEIIEYILTLPHEKENNYIERNKSFDKVKCTNCDNMINVGGRTGLCRSCISKSRVVSQETRDKISKTNKGKTSWMKGKKHSQETKDKISIANTKYYETKIYVVNCLNCNKEMVFYYRGKLRERKFCDRSCATTYLNKRRNKVNKY